jgi:hypothetical protein
MDISEVTAVGGKVGSFGRLPGDHAWLAPGEQPAAGGCDSGRPVRIAASSAVGAVLAITAA